MSSLLFSVGCEGVGECDVFPARCAPRTVQIFPAAILLEDRTYALEARFDAPWAQSLQLWGQILNSEGAVRATLPRQRTDSPLRFNLNPASGLLLAGTYSVRLGYGQDPRLPLDAAAPFRYELTLGGRPPTLSVDVLRPPTLAWQGAPSNPLAFIPSQTLASSPNLTVRGLWLGRGGSNLFTTELLLLQSFTTSTGTPTAAIRRSTTSNPTTSWIESAGGAGSLFSVWRFGSTAEVQNPRAVLWNETAAKQYTVAYGVLENPELSPEYRGVVTGVSVSAMAIAMLPASSTFAALAQTDSGIKSFISTGPSSLIERSIRNLPGVLTLTRMTGYADKFDGTGTAGVLGFTAAGEPALFKWDGTEFSYDPRSDQLRLPSQLGTVATEAVAVGDVDGNGYNDIVVARAGKVKFFLQLAGSFAPSATEVTPFSGVNIGALVIGQLDGLGKLDLAIADAPVRKCALSDCNQVYVYLNQTQ